MFTLRTFVLAAFLMFCNALVSQLVSIAVAQSVPSPSGKDASASATSSRLRYRWEPGKRYQYSINVTGEVLGTKLVNSAFCSVTPSKLDKPVTQVAEKPTASAFCVHADGYFISCAHVVEDAEVVEIILGGKTYAAKVVSSEEPMDLALLKIDAKSLSTLPLANSEAIEVGQEVRAFGYPLSDLLGEGLKATRGTVSGIDKRDGQKQLQIDASVNYGSSGGPVVNDNGQVIGVIACKVAGNADANISFAVPINYAKRLLAEQDLPYGSAKAGAKRDGPDLVKRVSPAVALVRTTPRPAAAAFALSVNGTITMRDESPSSIRSGFANASRDFGMLYSGRGVLVHIDEYGNILEIKGEQNIPPMLTGSPLIFLESLPQDGRTRWETSQQKTFIEKVEKRDDSFVGSRYLPPSPFRRREEQPTGKTFTAIEKAAYTLVKTEGDIASIKKQYELKTLDDPPSIHMTGTGTIEFDLKAGLPKNMDYTGSLAISVQNVTVKMPLKVTYKLYDIKDAASPASARPVTPHASSLTPGSTITQAPAKPAPKELSDAELTQALEELQDSSKRPAALSRLAEAKAISTRHGEVTKAVAPFLAEESSQRGAVAVLTTWGASAEHAAALLPLVDHNDPTVRSESIVLLGKLKHASAADAIAERLTQLSDRSAASDALRAIGPAAETSVLKFIKHTDVFTRREACSILADIGTSASLPTLAEHAKGKDLGMKLAAEAAMKSIEARRGH